MTDITRAFDLQYAGVRPMHLSACAREVTVSGTPLTSGQVKGSPRLEGAAIAPRVIPTLVRKGMGS